MTSFKKFLKEKGVCVTGKPLSRGLYICERDLGEWAFKEFIGNEKELKSGLGWAFLEISMKENPDSIFYNGRRTLLYQFAKACLGKEEIKKRLKELKKNE